MQSAECSDSDDGDFDGSFTMIIQLIRGHQRLS